MNAEHDSENFCNCESCWWARDQQEVCTCCGVVVHADTTE